MLGAFFAILAAAGLGLNTAAVRRVGVLGGSSTQAVYYSVLLGVPLLAVTAAFAGQLFEPSAIALRGYILLTITGLLHFLFGRYCNYRAINLIGNNRTAPMRAIQTPFSVLLALLLLGEQITALNALGIAMVMGGPIIMLSGSSTSRVRHAGGTYAPRGARTGPGGLAEPPILIPENLWEGLTFGASPVTQNAPQEAAFPFRVLMEGYIYGALAGVAYGTSPLLIRAALGDTGLGILGTFISYVAAAAVLMLSLAWPRQRASLHGIEKPTQRWLLFAAMTVTFAQLTRFIALDLAPVTVVMPLSLTAAIFSLFFAFIINRQSESFNLRVLAGIALAFGGSVAVVL